MNFTNQEIGRFRNQRRSVNRICIRCLENKPEPIFTEYCEKCRKEMGLIF